MLVQQLRFRTRAGKIGYFAEAVLTALLKDCPGFVAKQVWRSTAEAGVITVVIWWDESKPAGKDGVPQLYAQLRGMLGRSARLLDSTIFRLVRSTTTQPLPGGPVISTTRPSLGKRRKRAVGIQPRPGVRTLSAAAASLVGTTSLRK